MKRPSPQHLNAPRRRSFLIPLIGVLSCATVLSAGGNEPAAPDLASVDAEAEPTYLTVSGARVSERAMRAIMMRTTRLIAMALDEPELRELVYRAMLQPFLAEDGTQLAAGMAAKRSGTTQGAIRRSLDSLVNLEFYMPVAEHRRRWQPDDDLIVVFMLRDVDNAVIGFNLDGTRIPDLGPYEVPGKAMLSVVPAETDFSAPPGVRPVIFADECEPDTDDCGGGGGGLPTQYAGIVMLEWKIREKTWDPAPFGAPEFEVTIIDDISFGEPTANSTWNCAAEGWGTSDIPRWWNYDNDGTLETGQKRILDDSEDSDLNTNTPGVIVSEDDGQSCNSGHFPSVLNPDPFLNNDDPVGHFFYTLSTSATPHSGGDLLHLKLRWQ